ncbi:MAG: septum formation initiator family protein [Lachnospiraceae bacterium]|nr:septum formation initiator family protein [Lachnospiraceae bacterium]
MAIKRVIKKKRPKRLLGFIVLMICVLGLCAFFYQKERVQKKEAARLESEKRRIEALIKQEEKRAAELEDYKAYVQTKSYIEEVARDVLGLVYKNEVIFRPDTESKK